MSVYFIKCNEYVKIGYSKTPLRRISDLQNANPYNIEILLIIPGDVTSELELHKSFSDNLHRNEWFVFDEFMQKSISVLSGVFGKYSRDILNGYTDDDYKYTHRDTLYCKGGKKANVIRDALINSPDATDAEIAEVIGCTRQHVWSIRNNRKSGSSL